MKFTKIYVALFTLLSVFTSFKYTDSYAAESNQNTTDILVEVEDDTIVVEEKWKVILEKETFIRDIDIPINKLTNISAQLIFPNTENLNYQTSEKQKNSKIQIHLPKLKNKEVVLSLKYNIINESSITENLSEDKIVQLIYPNTSDNISLARLKINVKSELIGISSFDNTYYNNIKKDTDSNRENNKQKNSGKNDDSKEISDRQDNKENVDKKEVFPEKSKKKSTVKSIFGTIKTFIIDILVLVICTLAATVLSGILYIILKRLKNAKRKKFSKKKKSKKRNKFK